MRLHEPLGQSTRLSINSLELTYSFLGRMMGMMDFIERMMDMAIQQPDAIAMNLPLWDLIAAGHTLNLCENSGPIIMLHDITTMNSALCVIAHQSALTGIASSLNELTGFNSATDIDKSLLNRERKARESLIQCFARQGSIWMRIQRKIDQARGGHPLLDLDGLKITVSSTKRQGC